MQLLLLLGGVLVVGLGAVMVFLATIERGNVLGRARRAPDRIATLSGG